ncbi:MAG TPA: hypothetical protein ENJ46_01995 [Hellea balneolensis]|uniref:TonB C-terminal domain-containing protein n=1 Tax=Hellea balneolensis TaxID=287478 RepID=A0A7C3FYU9_9PROT|nr:hypothetical protein [Hellea balneolensis]
MQRFWILAFILSVLVFPALDARSAIPKEVLEPYKAYQQAQKDGDKDKASTYAYEAWQAAEKALGDSKTTGDLAFNYANIKSQGRNPFKNFKKREKAYKRSIELARFYDARIVGDVEVERRIALVSEDLTLNLQRGRKYVSGGSGDYFKPLEGALKKYELLGTTYEADKEALQARFYQLRHKYPLALEHAERASTLYKTREDPDTFSQYLYLLKFFRGGIFTALEQPIPALLEYQSLMQNLEGDLPSDHIFIQKSFTEWMRIRAQLESTGRLAEAEKAGLCECWPFNDYKNKAVPLKRVPPTMPRRANHSGHVTVKFDVDNDGHPYNIRAVESSQRLFIKSAVASVDKWAYSLLSEGEDEENRKDIVSTIVYRLYDNLGNIIPE